MEAEPEALRHAVLNAVPKRPDLPNEAGLSDLEWMEREVGALFVHDGNGRLVESNEQADSAPPPRFFLGLTRQGNLWRFRADLGGELVAELARLAAAERAPRELDALPERDAVLRERLADAAPIEQVFHGAAFRFPEALTAATESPDVVELGPGDERLVEESFPALAANLASRAPCIAFVEEGRAVSACYSATFATPLAACVEAGVETLPGFRGRGLASRTLAAWALSLRARGAVPLYSASLANRASLGVARRLGLIRFGSALHMR